MSTYNFKRNTQLYIVYASNKYALQVYPDVNFSQTFSEESVPVKTLHQQGDNFESATIINAAPANFNFSIPLTEERGAGIVFDLLVGFDNIYSSLNTFDLYAVTETDTYLINYCVIENGKFTIARNEILGLSVSGTGSKLARVGSNSYTIPGTLVPLPTQSTYVINKTNRVAIDGADISNITDIYLELRNEVVWTSNKTLQSSLKVTDVSNIIYPVDFTISSRVLNGAITRFIVDVSSAQRWAIGSPISIKTGNSFKYALQAIIPEAVFTNRLSVTDVYTEVFDFRMITNPSSLTSVLMYN